MTSGPSTPMPPKFSVIVPAKNAAKTLDSCLCAIFLSEITPEDVLVVDDASSDETSQIAAKFSCRTLRVSFSKGPMQPRLAGAETVSSPLLIFVDADICVRPDSFSRILSHFENPETVAVTGLLSASSPQENFCSSYKNEYMNFIFKRQPRESHFLYGSIFAVRKNILTPFEPVSEPFGSLVSDSELGMRLSASGHKICLDHRLEVVHLKHHSITSLLKNDFAIPFMFALIFSKYATPGGLIKQRGFSHAKTGQVIAAALSFSGFVCAGLGVVLKNALFLTTAYTALSAVWIYWFSFLKKTASRRGITFALQCLFFLPLDQAVMFAGMMSGFFYAFFKSLILLTQGVKIRETASS